jgi:hypothetical protein
MLPRLATDYSTELGPMLAVRKNPHNFQSSQKQHAAALSLFKQYGVSLREERRAWVALSTPLLFPVRPANKTETIVAVQEDSGVSLTSNQRSLSTVLSHQLIMPIQKPQKPLAMGMTSDPLPAALFWVLHNTILGEVAVPMDVQR